VKAGGALAQDVTTYADVVAADGPWRYYRLDETSGTVAYDTSASAGTGASPGRGVTYGVAGGLTGDADTALTLSAASSRRVFPAGNLPNGNAPFTIEFLVKFSANPASTQGVYTNGNSTLTNLQTFRISLDSGGRILVDVGGASLIISASLSTGTWHYVSVRYDGAGTLTLNVDAGAKQAASGVGTLALPASPGSHYWGAQQSGTAVFNGSLDECAEYATALSDARISAHQSAMANAPTANAANTMVIPSGGRIGFGSPVWRELNMW
jgi:hypothetical protein